MKAGTKVGIGIALVAAAIVIAGNLSDQNATTESIKDNTSERITDTQITQPLSNQYKQLNLHVILHILMFAYLHILQT